MARVCKHALVDKEQYVVLFYGKKIKAAMAKIPVQQLTFKGYSSPNYTPVPDELFDEQLPDLSGAELKLLLYIIRRTFGFKKESDNISLN
jgi:hypothetical protein